MGYNFQEEAEKIQEHARKLPIWNSPWYADFEKSRRDSRPDQHHHRRCDRERWNRSAPPERSDVNPGLSVGHTGIGSAEQFRGTPHRSAKQMGCKSAPTSGRNRHYERATVHKPVRAILTDAQFAYILIIPVLISYWLFYAFPIGYSFWVSLNRFNPTTGGR